MLGKAKVYATIGVKDIASAKEFYGQKLGLEVEKEDETGGVYYKCANGPVYVYPSDQGGTNKATCASWELNDIESLAKELRSKGVVFEHYPELEGVELNNDIHIWGTYKVVWFKDPSGNILAADNGGA